MNWNPVYVIVLWGITFVSYSGGVLFYKKKTIQFL